MAHRYLYLKLLLRNNTNDAELDIYQNAIRFIMAEDGLDEDGAAGNMLKELNGYSNSLLLYQIRAGVIALRAARQPITIRWEQAWLS